ncbi:MAG: hypothetical protein ACREBI_09145 [Nitrosotalea sp.]
MKLFSSFHNPKTRRYRIYYTTVLIAVTGTVVFTTLQWIHPNPLQGTMTFFEGFFSLFMLSRNETVGNAFMSSISSIANFIRS